MKIWVLALGLAGLLETVGNGASVDMIVEQAASKSNRLVTADSPPIIAKMTVSNIPSRDRMVNIANAVQPNTQTMGVQTKAELKALIEEYAVVEALRNGWTRAGQSAAFKTRVKALYEKLAAYTRTHAGQDLDVDAWGRCLFKRLCRHYLLLTLDTYPESETAIRELRELMAAAQPADKEIAPRLELELVFAFVQEWVTKHPAECAALWDEEGIRVAGLGDPKLDARWRFLDSVIELRFVDCARQLPAEERQGFYEQRFRKFLGTVMDERLSSSRRAKALRCWIVHLNALGRWNEASAVLDDWWTKYGETMTESDYYLSRMWAAWYGIGDWDKASDALRRFSRLVQEGKVQVSPKAYKELTGVYYARILTPVYELRRRQSAQAEHKKGNKQR